MAEPGLSYLRKPLLCLPGAWLIMSGAAAHIHHTSVSVPFHNSLSASPRSSCHVRTIQLKLQPLATSLSPLSVYQQAYLDLCLSGPDTSAPFPTSCRTTSGCRAAPSHESRGGKKVRAVIILLALSISSPSYFKKRELFLSWDPESISAEKLEWSSRHIFHDWPSF